MSKITVPNSEKKNSGLTRGAHGLLALEQRFMFDGAAVDTVADQVHEVPQAVKAVLFQTEAVASLNAEVVRAAQLDVKTYLANTNAQGLYAIFGDSARTPSAAWVEAAQKLIDDVLADRVNIQVKSLADSQMLGALGAFSANAENGAPVIYLNQRLLDSADNQKTLERVLVEEFGHFIDVKINETVDSLGDEGQRFAAQILGGDATSQWAATENDSAKLQIGDRLVDVELAAAPEVSVTFDKGYIGTQGTNTNQANDISNLSSAGITRIAFVQTDANGDGKFGDGGTQGNDLAGTLRITLADGSVHNLAGALNWRETTGSKVEVFGFILNDGQSLTRTFTVGPTTYNLSLVGGSETGVSSTIGLQSFNSTWTFTNLEDRSGNAATSGLLKALNEYLDLTPQPLSISANSVTEGQSLVYTVTLDLTTTTSFTYPFTFSYGTGFTAEDYTGTLSSSNFSNGVTLNADGTITVPTGVTSFTITLVTVSDAFLESRETATVTIGAKSATGSVVDAGTDTINVTSYGPVNEGSTYAMFTVEASGSQTLKLSVVDGTTTLTSPTIEYFNGTLWVPYVESGENVSMPTGGTVYVRVTITSESDTTYEVPEYFSLVASNSTNTAITDTKSTYIVDDGTGSRYDGALTAGTPNSSGVSLDDDRPVLSIGDVTVEEGSKAVFTVSLSNASEEALEIEFTTSVTDPLTAEAGDIDPTSLVVTYNNGTSDVVLTATAGKYTIPAGVTVLTVKVPTVSDAVYEGSETFTLSANVTQSYVTDTDLGTGTIKDDGTATDGDDEGTGVDNDRPVLSVVGVDDVSEGSYAVFTVRLDKALEGTTGIKLSLVDNSALISSDLNGTVMEVVTSLRMPVGSGTMVSNDGTFTLPAGTTTFYVRVLTKSDQPAVYEGAEKFALRASFTSAELLYADRTGLNATVRANASSADTSTILDDGTGKVYKPDGTEDLDAIKDDDRPKPEPLPLAVLPPAPPARVAEPVELVTAPPQVFSSTLDPVAPRLVPIEPPRPIGDVLTSQSGYRIPVNEAAAPGLSLNRGVTDQFVQGTQVTTKISLPFDAFIHSNKDAVIKLEAKQADNRSLPQWVQFDPVSGVFEVTPPKGFKGKLDLKVIARDDDGREVTALFQMFIGEQEKSTPQSRESFSEKLRLAGKRPITVVRMHESASRVTIREGGPHKVRAG